LLITLPNSSAGVEVISFIQCSPGASFAAFQAGLVTVDDFCVTLRRVHFPEQDYSNPTVNTETSCLPSKKHWDHCWHWTALVVPGNHMAHTGINIISLCMLITRQGININ
jgi:hypothetical protein